jgi:hypothetical protein
MPPTTELGLPGNPDYVSAIQKDPRLEGWYRFMTEGLPHLLETKQEQISTAIKTFIGFSYDLPVLPPELKRAEVVYEHDNSVAEAITEAKFPAPMVKFGSKKDYDRFLEIINDRGAPPYLIRHIGIDVIAASLGYGIAGQTNTKSRPLTVGLYCAEKLGDDYQAPEVIENDLLIRAVDPYYPYRQGDDQLLDRMIQISGRNSGHDQNNSKIIVMESEMLPLFEFFQYQYGSAKQTRTVDLHRLLAVPFYRYVSPRFMAYMATQLIEAASGNNAQLTRKLMTCPDLTQANRELRSYRSGYYTRIILDQQELYDEGRIQGINAFADYSTEALKYYFSGWPTAFKFFPDGRSFSSLWQERRFAEQAMTFFRSSFQLESPGQAPYVVRLGKLERMHLAMQALDLLQAMVKIGYDDDLKFDIDGIRDVKLDFTEEIEGNRATVSW